MEDRTAAAINHLQEQRLALATTTSAHFCARQNKSPLQYPIISHHPHLFITLFISIFMFVLNLLLGQSPVLEMAEVLQVEFSGVLRQIDGVHVLESKQRR